MNVNPAAPKYPVKITVGQKQLKPGSVQVPDGSANGKPDEADQDFYLQALTALKGYLPADEIARLRSFVKFMVGRKTIVGSFDAQLLHYLFISLCAVRLDEKKFQKLPKPVQEAVDWALVDLNISMKDVTALNQGAAGSASPAAKWQNEAECVRPALEKCEIEGDCTPNNQLGGTEGRNHTAVRVEDLYFCGYKFVPVEDKRTANILEVTLPEVQIPPADGQKSN